MKSKILKSINKDINKSIKPDKTNKLSNICIEEEICDKISDMHNKNKFKTDIIRIPYFNPYEWD